MAQINLLIITLALNLLLGGYILLLAPRRRANQLFAAILAAPQIVTLLSLLAVRSQNLPLAFSAAIADLASGAFIMAAGVHFALVYPKRTRVSLSTFAHSLMIGLVLFNVVGLVNIILAGPQAILFGLVLPWLIYAGIIVILRPRAVGGRQFYTLAVAGALVSLWLTSIISTLWNFEWWIQTFFIVGPATALAVVWYLRRRTGGGAALITPEHWANWSRYQVPAVYLTLLGFTALLMATGNLLAPSRRTFGFEIVYGSGAGPWLGLLQTTAVALQLLTFATSYQRTSPADRALRQQILVLFGGFLIVHNLGFLDIVLGDVLGMDSSWTGVVSLITLTATVGIALARHRFLDASLDALTRIANSTLDLDEVLALIIGQVGKVIEFTDCGILMVQGDEAMVRAHTRPDLRGTRVAWAGALQTRRPLLGRDAGEIPAGLPSPQGTAFRSLIFAPLVVRDRVLGAILVTHHEPHRYEQDDLEALGLFAFQVAVAVDNARLYEEQKKQYEREMETARQLQTNLLPVAAPQAPGISVAGFSQPAREVGGDFYHYFLLGQDVLAVAVGDVSGKGLQAALMMALSFGVLVTEQQRRAAPAKLLAAMNAGLHPHSQRNKLNTALCFVTVEPRNGASQAGPHSWSLCCANAGMVSPLVRRAGGAVEWVDARGLPLGIEPAMDYAQVRLDICRGDMVLLCTDGIVEAKNGAGQMYGFERLEAQVARFPLRAPDSPDANSNAQDLIAWIVADVRAFVGPAEQHDDLTAVALEICK